MHKVCTLVQEIKLTQQTHEAPSIILGGLH
jgi:hypothetical protein